ERGRVGRPKLSDGFGERGRVGRPKLSDGFGERGRVGRPKGSGGGFDPPAAQYSITRIAATIRPSKPIPGGLDARAGRSFPEAFQDYEESATKEIERRILELDADGFSRLAVTMASALWNGDHGRGVGEKGQGLAPAAIRTVTASEAREGLGWLKVFAAHMESKHAGSWALFVSGDFDPKAAKTISSLPGRVTVTDASAMAKLMFSLGIGTRVLRDLELKEIDPNFFARL
ncbi:MAG: hypothetical protein LBQ12_05240, partial [Deltaproteobacteria bacterium]|nr:hypothetical protein [Deltaproteobacteria bacterium]